MNIDPIQLDWLRTLISSYDHEHDWTNDEDPDASKEMLAECQRLHDWLHKVYVADDAEEKADGVRDEKDIHLVQDPDIPF